MEEKKPGFWSKLHKSKKKQVLFFVVSMVVLMGVYLPTVNAIETARETEHVKAQRTVIDFLILSSIDGFELKKEQILLSGWILRLDCENKDVRVIYKALDDSDIKICTTEMTERQAVNEYFSKENNFGKTGFTAQIKEKELNKETCYEILFSLDYENNSVSNSERKNKLVSSGKYYFAGKIYDYNPMEHYAPGFADENLNTVINEGRVQYSNIEMGCWVYSYNGRLYLIVNEKFGLTEDRTQRMKFHTHTAQLDLLSEERKQYGYDSRDFFFDEKEYALAEDSEYRVAILDIPDTYEVSWIELGMRKIGGPMLKDIAFLLSDWNELQ